jgi:hypothetical protein
MYFGYWPRFALNKRSFVGGSLLVTTNSGQRKIV